MYATTPSSHRRGTLVQRSTRPILAMSAPAAGGVYASVVPYYLGVGIISVSLAVVIYVLFACSRRQRTDHAGALITIITVCDALYTLKFFLSALFWNGGTDDRRSFHLFDDDCESSVAYGQFFGMAAISFNACLVYDFVAVLSNPLRNTAGFLRWYHVFSWSMASVTTIIVISRASHTASDPHTCWLRGDSGNSWPFEVPLFIYMIFAGASLVYAGSRLRSGSALTIRLRRAVLLRHALYVFSFVVLWLFPVVHAFTDPDGKNMSFSIIDAVTVSGQAAVFALIRFSEPGVLTTLESVLRKIYNTLALHVFGVRVNVRIPLSSEDEDESPIPLQGLCCLRKTSLTDGHVPLLGGRSGADAASPVDGASMPLVRASPTDATLSSRFDPLAAVDLASTAAAPARLSLVSPAESSAKASAGGDELPPGSLEKTPSASPGPSGWQDMSAELRIEMGTCMLSGLVQSLMTNTGGASEHSDRASGAAERAEEVDDVPLVQTRNRATSDSVFLAGPSAPVSRRTIGAILKSPSTRNNTFAVPSTLGAASGRIDVATLEDREFDFLRDASGLSSESIARNFDPLQLRSGTLNSQFSDGASSSFFCRSLDGQLVIKTVSYAEIEVLLRLLPAYSTHLEANPGSLLVRFFGAWALRTSSSAFDILASDRIYFVLMQNVFPISGAPPRALTFDIKGSTVNRRARIGKGGGASSRGTLLYQDLDLRESLPRGLPVIDDEVLLAERASRTGGPGAGGSTWGPEDADIIAGAARSRKIVDQMQRDVTLLASQGIMDYSLLLQVVPLSVGGSMPPQENGLAFPAGDAMLSEAAGAAYVRSVAGLSGARTGTASRSHISRWSPLAVSLCALGVSDDPNRADGSMSPATGLRDAARGLVQLGVIDVLQFFDATKQMESMYKRLRYGGLAAVGVGDATYAGNGERSVAADVSAVDPNCEWGSSFE